MDKDIKLINIFTKQALKDRDEEKYNEGWEAGNNYSTEQWCKEINDLKIDLENERNKIKDLIIELKVINDKKLLKDEKQTKLQEKINEILKLL